MVDAKITKGGKTWAVNKAVRNAVDERGLKSTPHCSWSDRHVSSAGFVTLFLATIKGESVIVAIGQHSGERLQGIYKMLWRAIVPGVEIPRVFNIRARP